MWGGVLFFLFWVGSVFYILEHTNSWIKRSSDGEDVNNSEWKNQKPTVTNVNVKTFLHTKTVPTKVKNNFFCNSVTECGK